MLFNNIIKIMNLKDELVLLNKNYKDFVYSNDKKELKIFNVNNKKGLKMQGFLHLYFYKRNKLIKNGNIITGYLYRIFNDTDLNKVSIGYVIHTPNFEIQTEINKFKEIENNINNFLSKDIKTFKEKKIYNSLVKNNGELHYFLLDKEISGYDFIYISTIPILINEAKIGLNYFISNKKYSNEILLLNNDLINKIKNFNIKEFNKEITNNESKKT